MKKQLLLPLFLLFIFGANAQKINIVGTVLEEETDEKLEYATIIFTPTDKDEISGGITNAEGDFDIEIKSGTYDIAIEFLSLETKTILNRTLTKDTNLGVIKLNPSAEALDAVEIIAEKSTVEIRLDKRIYNVGKDMTVKGGNASDVLDNVPSVNVDVEGNVSLRGSENVRILIDGKPSALVGLSGTDALRQLPADAIERVEVITSPSARYDAEGTAGILNIILRKGKTTGLNGSINATIGDPEQYQIAANINLRGKKVNLFTNIGYNKRTGPGNSLTKLSTLENGVVNSLRIEDREFERDRSGYNVNLGLEYYLTKESSLTGTVFFRDSDNGSLSNNNINVFDGAGLQTSSDIRIQNEEETDKTTQFSLNYTNHLNKSGHKLTADFQYSDSEEIEKAFINDATGTENNISSENSKNTLLQTDYVLPIGENSQFEIGYRGEFQDLTSDFLVTPTLTPDPSNNLVFKQNVNAIYSQFGSKVNKFSYLFGLRTEITDVKVRLTNTNENFDYNYVELFPTVNLGYERTDDQSFTLGYSRRLRRPRFWYLNPFESRNSQNVIFKGNPGLIPTFTNSFDLGYLQKLGKLTLNSSVYFQHSKNNISRVSRDEIRPVGIGGANEIVTIREPINLASEDRYGFEVTTNYNPSKKVRLSASFNVYKSETKGNYTYNEYSQDLSGNITSTPVVLDLGNKNTSWFTRFNARVTLPAKIQWQTRLFYRGPSETAQSKTEGIFSANLAFSKDICKEKGTLVFNVSDVFNSRKRQSITSNPNIESPTSINDQTFQWRVRQVSLNFTYRFNQKKKRERPSGGGFEGGGEGVF